MQRHCLLIVACALLVACGGEPTGPLELSEVRLSSTSVTLSLGDTARLDAQLFDGSGSPITDRTVRWSSNSPAVAIVSPEGRITALGAGSTSIVAESGGVSADATIQVTVAILAVSGGFSHSCATTGAGKLACWGFNGRGKLGTGTLFSTPSPALVAGTIDAPVSVTVGATQSCVVDSTGVAYCWGSNGSAQLGIDSIDGRAHAAPVPVAGSHRFTTLETGARHACALEIDGTTYCWGGGGFGQLGLGPLPATCEGGEPCSMTPEPITAQRFNSISAGQEHTCGIADDDSTYCWGLNFVGALGDSSDVSESLIPVRVAGGLSFASISAGGSHTCGITADGTAFCWGMNNDGRLGDSTTTSRNYPVPVSGGLAWSALAAGGSHTCGLTTASVAYCWGIGVSGQLGNGARASQANPMPVNTGLTFRTITAGNAHTCGIATDDRAYCWGENGSGQLGVGSGGDRLAPALVNGQS